MAKKISLAEVARSLGVSKTLVSLVINNKADEHGISAETQQRVREKIKELNYQPDVLAQGFRTGKTKTIGLIVSDISNLFYSRLARRIEDYAWLNGYSVVICSTDEDISKELEQIRMLKSRKIDGLIVSSSQADASFFNKLADENYPHVLIDRIFTEMRSPNVSVDNFGGARMAARHLLSQGMRNFCVISITPEHISTINERLKGFESALNEMGIKIPEEWHIRAPFHQIDQAVKEGIQRIYQSAHLPEAIFTLNNNLTSTTLKYLRKLSVRIPEEMALIGFDDLVYFAYTHPSVSAIEQPIDRIGEKSFELLLRQIQKEKIPPHERSIYLPVDIIIRESSIKT
ncbi:MAG TPA: LacI family DNA-binding transcriptional regulator [Bacteroidales bacterium]|jgi:LacI family transcriptional regulator|nr:LacI family DNA-binding transcriptional regulator [Bacteroidales bacterium]